MTCEEYFRTNVKPRITYQVNVNPKSNLVSFNNSSDKSSVYVPILRSRFLASR